MIPLWGTSTAPNPTLSLDFVGATSLDAGITFSRGSQATLFDSAGTLVYAKHNLLLQSEDFATTWTVTGATVSTNAATAPNGTATADKLAEDSSTGSHLVSQNITYGVGTYTASLFAKKAERDWVRVLFFDGTNTFSAFFNLNTGVVGTVTGTGASAAIQSVGDGWYRCLVTATTAAGAGTFAPRVALADNNSSYTGSTGSGIFIWGAQLNLAGMEGGVTSSLATYYPTTTAAYYAPRFDYNPSTLAAQGLLIEEQRTNSIRNNTMQGAVAGTPGTLPTNWSTFTPLTGLTREIVGTGTESGITYIDVRVSGTPSAAGLFLINFESNTQNVASNGQSWSGSTYCKLQAGSLTGISSLVLRTSALDAAQVEVSNTSQTFTPTTAALSTQRISANHTNTSASTAYEIVYLRVSLSGVAIDITLRIGLPQLELGAFATSVIPTTTTALTRNADVASMTGTNFSSWFNPTASTLYVEWTNIAAAIPSGGSQLICDISDGTASNFYRVFQSQVAGTKASTNMFSGGVNPGRIDSGGAYSNATVKAASAFAASDRAISANGNAATTSATGALPINVNRMNIGAEAALTNFINGYIRRIAYYPVRLPNSTLQALTA